MIGRRMNGSGYTRRLVACATALGCLAFPAAASADGIVVEKRAAPKRAVERYWTPQRMERARPLDAVRRADGGLDLRAGPRRPNPPAYESGRVADPVAPGNAVNGKLFGRIGGFGPYTCSATSIDAANRNTIVTAGHCVVEPRNGRREARPAKKLAFVPGYEEGTRPFGTWVFDRFVVYRSWRRNTNFNFDYSAVEMRPRSGVNLEDAVGGARVATNLPVEETYYAVGYPENLDDGEVMRYCRSPFAGFDPIPIKNGPTPIGMGCDMSFGASGGGWFVDGYLNSLTSFGYDDRPEFSYGPYFGTKAGRLFAAAAR
jgi:hypothetical protein